MQLSTGAGNLVNFDLHDTLAPGELASPGIVGDAEAALVATFVAFAAAVWRSSCFVVITNYDNASVAPP